MGTASVLRRLLWREFREGLGIFLLCLAAPPLLFTVAARFINSISGDNTIALLVALPASAGVPLAVALWAARKGNTRKNGSEFVRTHLPVHHLAEWLVSLFVPLFIVALPGVWYGYWSTRITSCLNIFEISYYGALNLAALFTLCYFISSAISYWVSVFFGMAWLISGGLISPWDLHPLKDAETLSLVIRLVMGSVAASFIYVAMWQKKSVAYRQGVSLLLLIIIVIGPLLLGLDIGWFKSGKQGWNRHWFGSVAAPDNTSRAERYTDGKTPDNVSSYIYENYLTHESLRRKFAGDVVAVGMPDRWRVFMLQLKSNNDKLHILLWDTRKNSVRNISTIPVAARNVNLDGKNYGVVSPDADYMLVMLNSLRNEALDLWVVNLNTGHCEIAYPCSQFSYIADGEVAWSKNKAILYGYGFDKAIEVDLRTMKGAPLHIFEDGGRL